jgi:hypothetical protein
MTSLTSSDVPARAKPLCPLCASEHWSREGCAIKPPVVDPSDRQAVRAAERAKGAATDASAPVPNAPKTAEAIRSARYRAKHQDIVRARNRNRMRLARKQSAQAKRAHAMRGKRATEPSE